MRLAALSLLLKRDRPTTLVRGRQGERKPFIACRLSPFSFRQLPATTTMAKRGSKLPLPAALILSTPFMWGSLSVARNGRQTTVPFVTRASALRAVLGQTALREDGQRQHFVRVNCACVWSSRRQLGRGGCSIPARSVETASIELWTGRAAI